MQLPDMEPGWFSHPKSQSPLYVVKHPTAQKARSVARKAQTRCAGKVRHQKRLSRVLRVARKAPECSKKSSDPGIFLFSFCSTGQKYNTFT